MVTRSRMKRAGTGRIPIWLREDISQKIREEYKAGHPIPQAVAIAYSRARREHPKFISALARRESLVS
jgi:hypothetical protein